MSKQRISSGSPYEPRLGISRAIRSGCIIAVAGTAPIGPDGKTVGDGDPAVQARRCIEIIGKALEQAGASLSDVIRTRILLTRIEDWEQVGLVHGEFFSTIRPANTVMQVTRFIDPEWLVEIEADAVIDD
ncbi:MAG TPA: RidA family protein [Ktedonobacteraceae bacterium]|nr:RidA family protein [Ktedonobacteraceae bacterium]